MNILCLLLITIIPLSALINPMNVYTAQKTITQTTQIIAPSATALTATPQVITVKIEQQPVTTTTTTAAPSNINTLPQSSTQTAFASATFSEMAPLAGTYNVTNPLSYENEWCGIFINQSNTILDLNNQTLSYNPTETRIIHGIIIKDGISNITIKNGIITGFSGTGIIIKGSNTICHNIVIDNIKIIDCGNGIHLSTIKNASIKNCCIMSCKNRVSPTIGVKIKNGTLVRLQHIITSNNSNDYGQTYGFLIESSSMIFVKECASLAHQSVQKSIGFYFLNTQLYNLIDTCNAQAHRSLEDDACGFLLENTQKTFLENSYAQHNQTDSEDHNAYGIKLSESTYTTIRNNHTEYNDYGIYDDEPRNQETNTFIKNYAILNRKANYLRPFSTPFSQTTIKQNFLQKALQTSHLENISIVT